MQQSLKRQMMANGGSQKMVDSMEADIDAMTKQLESKIRNKYGKRQDDPNQLYKSTPKQGTGARAQRSQKRSESVKGRRRESVGDRPISLPQLAKSSKKDNETSSNSHSSAKAIRKTFKEQQKVQKDVDAQRNRQEREADNQPQKKANSFASRRTRLHDVQPPRGCETEDAMILRNIRDQWKQIQYAIKAIDLVRLQHYTIGLLDFFKKSAQCSLLG
jgi:hypothetical protein